jgi:putative membrane protein
MTNALVAALHFIGAFGVIATVFAEWIIFNPTPTFAEARRLQRCDAWYGLSALVVMVAGGLRVFFFEKGSAFYLGNPVFHLKMALFLGIAALSIYPTVVFIRWRKATRNNAAPTMTTEQASRIALLLRLEMVLLAAMIVAASVMAKGIGL